MRASRPASRPAVAVPTAGPPPGSPARAAAAVSLAGPMVWKSERWQAKVAAIDGVDGDEAALAKAGPDEPQTLEISYCRPGGGEARKEFVFEDAEDEQQPRLLVSLHAVSSLRELCEHEHARYDKVVTTLTQCRSSYYKELRWLREQLHLAYQTDEQAMVRRANLTPDDFEVYWFQPQIYLDDATKEYLQMCIRESTRKLIEENSELRMQLTQSTLLDSNVVPSVLRQLRKEHAIAKILREFRGQIKKKNEIEEFNEVACELVEGAAVVTQAPELVVQEDPALLDALEERDAVRQKLQESEELIDRLRAQLAQGIDAQLERERADAERERANLVQKRVERLEAQQHMMEKELADSSSSMGDCAMRMNRSVSKLSDLLMCLSPLASACCSPHLSSSRRRSQSVDKDSAAATFDDALEHLDEVALGLEVVAQEVSSELQALRAKVATLEMERAREQQEQHHEVEREKVEELQTTAATSQELERKKEAELEALKRVATVRSSVLETQLTEARQKLAEEQAKRGGLQKELGEAHGMIEQLNARLQRVVEKYRKVKGELRELRAQNGEEVPESDDEDEQLWDFLIPYRKRVSVASGKARWELLAEDAICSRRKRDHLMSLKFSFMQEPNAQPEGRAEVSAAFRFLSRPVQCLLEEQAPQLQLLRQVLQRGAGVGTTAGRPPSRSLVALSSPLQAPLLTLAPSSSSTALARPAPPAALPAPLAQLQQVLAAGSTSTALARASPVLARPALAAGTGGSATTAGELQKLEKQIQLAAGLVRAVSQRSLGVQSAPTAAPQAPSPGWPQPSALPAGSPAAGRSRSRDHTWPSQCATPRGLCTSSDAQGVRSSSALRSAAHAAVQSPQPGTRTWSKQVAKPEGVGAAGSYLPGGALAGQSATSFSYKKTLPFCNAGHLMRQSRSEADVRGPGLAGAVAPDGATILATGLPALPQGRKLKGGPACFFVP